VCSIIKQKEYHEQYKLTFLIVATEKCYEHLLNWITLALSDRLSHRPMVLCSCQPNDGRYLPYHIIIQIHSTQSKLSHQQYHLTNFIHQHIISLAKFPTTRDSFLEYCNCNHCRVRSGTTYSPKWYVVDVVRHRDVCTQRIQTQRTVWFIGSPRSQYGGTKKFAHFLSEQIMRELSRHRFFNSYVAFWYISRRKGACFYKRYALGLPPEKWGFISFFPVPAKFVHQICLTN